MNATGATMQPQNFYETATFLKVFCRVWGLQVASQDNIDPHSDPSCPTSELPEGPQGSWRGSHTE